MQNKQKGSINIILTDGADNTSKENVIFEYEKVAEVVDGRYEILEAYKNITVDFNKINYAADLEKAAQEVEQCVKTQKKEATDAEGKAVIPNLDEGIYLLKVSDHADYETVHSTLVTIPAWNEEQQTMDYDITVIPKHSFIEQSTTESRNPIPQTGDTNAYIFYVFLVIITAVCICFIKNYPRNRDVK